MQEHPLHVIIDEVVGAYRAEEPDGRNVDTVTQRVLDNPQVRLMRRGLDDHDRGEGLEDVFLRDVHRLVSERLED